MIKAAHIGAITEYITSGAVPVTEKGVKGVVAYGTETVKKNFGASNIAFVADALIHGATKQIMRWVNKVQKLLSWIPGADKIMGFVNLILSTVLNYIDEAVLSYVFSRKTDENGFKKACDGLSYYAQSWKNMLMGAFKVAAFIWIFRIAAFIIFYIIFVSIGRAIIPWGALADLFALVFALILLYGTEAIIVVPFATCVMILAYHKAIEGQVLKADIHATLCKVSAKFRALFEKAGQKISGTFGKKGEEEDMPTEL